MAAHAELGLELLKRAWSVSADVNEDGSTQLADLVDRVFEGSETGYKKAIIIQATGKAADPSLDAQSMQKGEGLAGSWDAREFAKQTFVAWNVAAGRPFTHSADPYVSNPYRIPRFDISQRAQRQRKREFDAALAVMEALNESEDSEICFANLVEVLRGLRRWIADKEVDYPLPLRASMTSVSAAIKAFLGSRSGGTRLQAIVDALVESLASAGFAFQEVSSGHINAADTASKSAGDVTYTVDGRASAVEVKDRPLTMYELLSSIEKARVGSITDLLFVIRAKDMLDGDIQEDDLGLIVEAQFSSGLNIYVERFDDFSRICLALIGESGRRRFLEQVGISLSKQAADISHKWAWAAIVKDI
jgi:hypothetical protein